jgi:hypothetical protein
VVKALRNRELAIEAMKRKIETKMRSQGMSSHDAVVQQIATDIVDNAETPAATPSVQSPEPTGTSWEGDNTVTTSKSTPSVSPPIAQEPEIEPDQVIAEDDDEEARLVAELEAERQAEEKARQKRQGLEDRLASARVRKIQKSTNVLMNGGDLEDVRRSSNIPPPSGSPTQDSMSIFQ